MSIMYTLNIGLGDPSFSSRTPVLEWPRRLKIALSWAMALKAVNVRFEPAHDGEPTLVVGLRDPNTPDDKPLIQHIGELAQVLEQDAIAVFLHGVGGFFLGQHARDYGDFDQSKFIFLGDYDD